MTAAPGTEPPPWQHGGMDLTVPLAVIGVVRSGHTDPEATPIQAGLNTGERGLIEIAGAYRDGLDGLRDFGYAWLLTWLQAPGSPAAGPPPLRPVPFLLRGQRRRVGVFATRSPRRPTPIGLSLIRLLDVSGGEIHFAGVDLLDGTPVIDIKPYVTRFDRPPGDPACGWLDQVAVRDGSTPRQLGQPES